MKTGTVLTDHQWLSHPDELVTRYNSWDCYNTGKLIPHIKQQLINSKNNEFFENEFWPMIPVIGAMQRLGVGELDKKARNSMRARLRNEIATLEKDILDGSNTTTYSDKLFNSPKQLAKLLFDDWGLPSAPPTRKRRARSTDLASLAWTLGHLRKKDDSYRARLHDLFHRSRLQTILERYLVIEGDSDGRIRPTIKLGGTETGRVAYAGGPGEAIQQWPFEIRGLIRARDGYTFVSRDYSYIEAIILAVLSQDHRTLEAIGEGRDIHVQNCRDLFGFEDSQYEDFEPVRKLALRNFAKTFLYGLSYGGKTDSMNMKLFCPCFRCTAKAPPQVNLSKDEVKRAAARWEQAHPAIMDYRAKLIESIYGYGKDRTWTSPFGYHRFFIEPREHGERSALNNPMQHCASVIINRAMRQCHAWNIPLTLQMHDELVAEVPIDEYRPVSELMRRAMEAPVMELANTVFRTKAATGPTWADLK